MSTPLRLVALLVLCWTGPATAQTAPAERAWTDPPVRGAVAAPAAQPAPEAPLKAPKVAEAARPRAEILAPSRARSPRVAALRRRPVTVVRALTPTHPGLGRSPVRVVRVATPARTWTPAARPVRYGFVAPPPPVGFYEDPRAQRIRQAEAAGYLVVRRSTVAAPDGRILYGYRSYDSDETED